MIQLKKITFAVLVAGILVVPATAAFAQNSGDWTTGGPIDYSKINLKGQKVVWSDNGTIPTSRPTSSRSPSSPAPR